jgi:glyoxylase-like metal-dependent hydrolase (beta-lactamase superfamily II)
MTSTTRLRALTLALACATPALTRAQVKDAAFIKTRGLTEADFPRTKELAPNVYVYSALRNEVGGQKTTNDLVVIGRDGVLVADGQGNLAQTQQLVDWIKTKTPQPIKYVIVCSDHGDHTGGNAAFPSTATFIASPFSKKVLEQAAKPPFPTEEVAQRRVIHLGSVDAEVLPLGRSHTGGDLSVWVPSAKVLFLSETYDHQLFPAMRSAYPSEWIQTIKNAQAMNATWYVPGHGFVDDAPTMARDLDASRQALERIVAEARRLHDAKIPCAASASRGTAAPREPCDAVRQGNWGDLANWTVFDSQVETAVRRIYDELDGKLP